MKLNEYKKLVDYTLGLKKADLVLKNGNCIMVQSKEIVKCDIAIENGYIVGIGNYDGKKEIDMTGKYISPGFVDSHLHFESTMANPRELTYYASLEGTTTFIADPHEAANVSGLKGIEFMLDSTSKSKADVYFMMPSCVPCKEGEDNGVILDAKSMYTMLENERILGLGEVMDTKAVIGLESSMIEKLKMYENRAKDGHALGMNSKELSAYAMAGILTDHECSTYEQAIEEVRNGMYCHIREGSAARNLNDIVSGIVENRCDTSRFTFCTDDKHIEDIKREGHISHNIRKSIELGLDPKEAYKMATYNAAQCYNLKEIGMIAPGKLANLVVLDNFEKVSISDVMYKGEFIDKNIEFKAQDLDEIGTILTDTVHIDWFDGKNIDFKSKKYGVRFIEGELLTEKVISEEIKNKIEYNSEISDEIVSDQDNVDVENKLIVLERHKNTGKYHTAKAYGYGIRNGAIASSVSHDSHNIIAIGDNDRDILYAIEELKRLKGGYILVSEGVVLEALPLPIMGLMSNLCSNDIDKKLKKMIDYAHNLGVKKGIDPFITLSFAALPVIPEVRITTNGLYDVVNDAYLD